MNNFLLNPADDVVRAIDKGVTPIRYFDVDLSVAHSIDALTDINIAERGNSLYIDLASAGVGTLYLQNDQGTTTPILVIPGFVLHAPFSGLTFENVAQPGGKLRVIFGTDIDFNASSFSNVFVSNLPLPVSEVAPNGSHAISSSPVAANGNILVLAIASNVRGVVVRSAQYLSAYTPSAPFNFTGNVMASTLSPPSIFTDGPSYVAQRGSITIGGNKFFYEGQRSDAVQFGAGYGLYFVNMGNFAEFSAQKSIFYTLN